MYEKKVSSDREEGKTNIQPEKVFILIPTYIKVFAYISMSTVQQKQRKV